MKKYILSLVAVIVVAAIGIYFGNPELFQGRIFSGNKVQGSYVTSKDLCYKYIPPEEVQGNGPAEETEGTIEITPPSTEKTDGVDTNTGTERRGGGSDGSESENENPNINITIPGVGGTIGTVAPGSSGTSGTSESSKGGKEYETKPTIYPYNYTSDCSCRKNGEVIETIVNSDGSETKTRCWLPPEQCVGGKIEYICPRGEEYDWNKIYDMCLDVKTKSCYGAAGPKFNEEGQAFCKIFQPGVMTQNCFPSETCQEIVNWSTEGMSSGQMVGKYIEKGLSEKEAQEKIWKEFFPCLEESFIK